MNDKTREFQKEFRALIEKYRPEVSLNRGYYGDIYGVDFAIPGDNCIAVTKNLDSWRDEYLWDFGNGLEDLK